MKFTCREAQFLGSGLQKLEHVAVGAAAVVAGTLRVRHLFDGRGCVTAYRAAHNVAQQHDEKVLVAFGDEET